MHHTAICWTSPQMTAQEQNTEIYTNYDYDVMFTEWQNMTLHMHITLPCFFIQALQHIVYLLNM